MAEPEAVLSRASMIAETRPGPVEYRMHGDGPVVLILHGGHSSCRETFGLEVLVQNGFSVLVPSRPGYGATPASVGRTAEASAAAMVGLLDCLDLRRVAVVAISASGPTGIRMASGHPERVSRLVLESAVTKTWLSPEDGPYRTARVMFNPRLQWLTWFMVRRMSNLLPRYTARRMVSSFSKRDVDEVMEQMSDDDVEAIRGMNNRQSSGRGFMMDLEHRVTREVLEGNRIPTLIVHSPDDGSVSFEHALHAHRFIPDSELFSAPTWGHLIWIGQGADEVNRKVVEFLRR